MEFVFVYYSSFYTKNVVSTGYTHRSSLPDIENESS